MTSSTETLTVAPEDAGTRLDRVLAAGLAELSRTRLKALILDGAVTAGGRAIDDPGYKVKAGRSADRRGAAARAGRTRRRSRFR